MAKVFFDSQNVRPPDGGQRLEPGKAVQVLRIDDPWLRRYCGQVGAVLLVEEDAVEVGFPGNRRQFFLAEEVAVLDDQEGAHALLSDGPESRISGAQLRTERLEAGVSQAAVARALDVSQTRAYTIEQEAVVRPATVAAYRSALNVAAGRDRSR